MAFNPTTDFVGLWRNTAGVLSKLEMPGLDFVVAALSRAGVVTVTVSATAPVANQATTAWLKAAVPSTSAEGALFLWDPVATAYAAATPALFLTFLEACAGESGIAWWTCTGGPPANVVGRNGDLAIRIDQPGGIYGPKALGAWPTSPIPGTTNGFASDELDSAFGAEQGDMLYRDVTLWKALAIGATGTLLASNGSQPFWTTVAAELDNITNTRGAILYRGAGGWTWLAPSTAGFALKTNGAGADPAWGPPEFTSGTRMLFQQTNAPTGWTKDTTANDVGLRVTSGTATGNLAGNSWSTVFGQTAVGNTTISTTQMPSHNHPTTLDGNNPVVLTPSGSGITAAGVSAQAAGDGAFSMSNTGGDGPHTHSITMSLSYVDVIIATKN
jgi:hypothetical protein